MKKFAGLTIGIVVMALLLTQPVFASDAKKIPGIRPERMEVRLPRNEVVRINAPFAFQAFGMSEVEGIEVRFLDSGKWTTWRQLRYEEEDLAGSELVFLRYATMVQARANHHETVWLTFLEIHHQIQLVQRVVQADGAVFETGFPEELRVFRKGTKKLRIISRAAWGADESLLIDSRPSVDVAGEGTAEEGTSDEEKNGQNICEPMETAFPGQFKIRGEIGTDQEGRALRWPRQYSEKVKKIVIHHTAQTLRDLDGDQIMTKNDYLLATRAIYTYHTVSRGWGDVGYHYLVDPMGNIYEGRSGGKDVIGAHVLCQNTGTIGISVMGNFEVDQKVPEPAFEALVDLSTYLADLYDINPLGKSSFRGEVLPHISTHAEIGAVTKSHIGRGATQCPGGALISRMPELRKLVSEGGIKPDFAFSYVKPVLITVSPLSSTEVRVELINRGEQIWKSLEIFPRSGKKPVKEIVDVNINPGTSYALVLPLTSSLDPGNAVALFKLGLNGFAMKQMITIPYEVLKPVYAYELSSLSFGGSPLLLNEKRKVSLELKNTGNFPWKKEGPFAWELVEALRRGKTVMKAAKGMSFSLAKIGDVPVGNTATFSFDLPVQKKEGQYSLELLPLVASEKGLKGQRIRVKFDVERPKFAAEVRLENSRLFVRKGFQDEIELSIMNTGNFEWEEGAVEIDLEGNQEFSSAVSALKRGEEEGLVVLVQAGYDAKTVELTGTLKIDLSKEKFVKNPARPAGGPARKFRIPFTVSVPTRGTVRLLAELVEQTSEWVVLKNIGNVPWWGVARSASASPLRDGDDAIELRSEKGTVTGVLEEDVVLPGQTGKFQIHFNTRKPPKRAMRFPMQLVAGKRIVKVRGAAVEIMTNDQRANLSKPNLSFRADAKRADYPGIVIPSEAVIGRVEESLDFDKKRDSSVRPLSADSVGMTQGIGMTQQIRVLLSTVNTSPIIITSPVPFTVWDSKTLQIRELPAGTEFTVSADDLGTNTVIRVRANSTSYLELLNVDRKNKFGSKTFNDNRYRGVIELRQRVGASVTVINELPLEDYMKGIAEEPESDEISQEKRKVIAVLSRSYALHYLISGYEKFPGKPYNASDDPAVFQKYLGFRFEERSPKWQQALKDTDNEVLLVDSDLVPDVTREKRVLRAAYFSCTDGPTDGGIPRTKTPEQAGWGNQEYFQRFGPVFASVEDPLGDDPLRQGFKECGHQVGLSGYGASAMARQGKAYREIMGYYYQHTEIKKW